MIVGVTTDALSISRKQKKPIIPQEERVQIVEAIRYVDQVVLQEDMDKLAAVRKHHVDVVFVGSDWQGTAAWENYEKEFAKEGCSVVYLSHTDGISSSILREKING